MPFPIEDKLVIAVSSSALFDLSESDKVFREQGPAAYKQFQEEQLNTVFLGGMDKRRILNVLKPHIFFDDQLDHLKAKDLAMVHVPFGVANIEKPKSRQGRM